jgi:hypothetical protein
LQRLRLAQRHRHVAELQRRRLELLLRGEVAELREHRGSSLA